MNERQINIVLNVMTLHVLPEIMSNFPVFPDSNEVLEFVYLDMLRPHSDKSSNKVINDEVNDYFIELRSKTSVRIFGVFFAFSEEIQNLESRSTLILPDSENESAFEKAEKIISDIQSTITNLPSLDIAFEEVELMKFVALLNSESPTLKKLQSLMDCFAPLFECFHERQNVFFNAAKTSDIKLLEEYVEFDLDLNALDQDGNTALMLVVKYQQNTALKYLLKQDVEPEYCSYNNNSAFYYAVSNNDAHMFEQLSDASSDLSELDWDYILLNAITLETDAVLSFVLEQFEIIPDEFIHQVIKNKWHTIFELLIERGLDINVDLYADSLLLFALREKDLVLANILLNAGADVNATDVTGHSHLHRVLNQDNWPQCDLLLEFNAKLRCATPEIVIDVVTKFSKHKNISFSEALELLTDDLDNDMYSDLLKIAIKNNDLALAKSLIPNISDLNTLYDPFNTVMEVDNLEMLEALISAGLDIDAKIDDAGFILEELAYYDINDNRIIFLIDNGANVNFICSDKKPFLHNIVNSSPKLVKKLLEVGLDPDIKNMDGFTCVQLFISNPDVFEPVLLDFAKAGSDFSLDTPDGILISHILAACYDVELVKQVIEICDLNIHNHGKHNQNMFTHATYMNNYEVMALLAGMGASVNLASRTQVTPLSLAISRGDLKLVKLLVEDCAVNVEQKFIGLYAPVDLAKKLGKDDIAAYLS